MRLHRTEPSWKRAIVLKVSALDKQKKKQVFRLTLNKGIRIRNLRFENFQKLVIHLLALFSSHSSMKIGLVPFQNTLQSKLRVSYCKQKTSPIFKELALQRLSKIINYDKLKIGILSRSPD